MLPMRYPSERQVGIFPARVASALAFLLIMFRMRSALTAPTAANAGSKRCRLTGLAGGRAIQGWVECGSPHKTLVGS